MRLWRTKTIKSYTLNKCDMPANRRPVEEALLDEDLTEDQKKEIRQIAGVVRQEFGNRFRLTYHPATGIMVERGAQ